MTGSTNPRSGTGEQTAESPAATSSRSKAPAVLVTVATILAVLGMVSVWARAQMLNTDDWVELSSELLEDPVLQEALSTYLVSTVYDQTDVPASLEARIPDAVQGLAAPVAGALRGPLTDSVERLIRSDRFQSLWETANRVAHEGLVAILRDDTREGVSTSAGAVAIDTKPLLIEVTETIGLSGDRIRALPDDTGRIVVVQSDELASVQQLVAVAEFVAWLLFVVVVALYTLAVYLAKGRRIAALRTVGWGLVVVGVTVLAVRAVAVRGLLDAIVQDPSNRTIADEVAWVATGLLRQMAWSVLIYGALIILFTELLGDRPWAVTARRTVAPMFTGSVTGLVAGTAVFILLLMWWSPGRAFERWTTALILVALVVGAVTTVRAQLQRESQGLVASPTVAVDAGPRE